MKKWGDRARDRTIIKHGMTKSSMKVILSLESNFKNIQTLKQPVLPENTRKVVLKLHFTIDANEIINTVFCRLFVFERKLSLNWSVGFYPRIKVNILVLHLNSCRIPKICEIVLESQKVCSGDSPGEHGCVCQGKQQGTHDIQTFKRIPGRGDTK